MAVPNGWSNYFQEVSRLVEEAERLYGMANYTYTEYIVERLEPDMPYNWF